MSAADWQKQAACLTADPDLFVTAGGAKTVPPAAATRCRACPVTTQCLEAAMEEEKRAGRESRYGIFGGLSPAGRHALYLVRERAAREAAGLPEPEPQPRSGGRPLAKCGTASAYNRHLRNSEPIDDDCRRAHRAHRRAQRSKHGTRSGYKAHRARGEKACQACRDANSAADRRLRTTGTTKVLT